MGFSDELENLLGEEEINDMIAKLHELKDKIKFLVMVYELKDSDGEVNVVTSAGTGIPIANLLLDEAKDAFLHGYEVE
jgi:hypothetical protein